MLLNISMLVNCTMSLLHTAFLSVLFFNCGFVIFRALSTNSDVGGFVCLFSLKLFCYEIIYKTLSGLLLMSLASGS